VNRYGRAAQQHWERHLPDRYAKLRDPAQFFQDLGDRAADEIASTVASLAAKGPSYLGNVEAQNASRRQAEELVREWLLPNPEPPRPDLAPPAENSDPPDPFDVSHLNPTPPEPPELEPTTPE
jgi:hypothetical protein